MIGHQIVGYRVLCELCVVKSVNGIAIPPETGGNGESHQRLTGYWKVIAVGTSKFETRGTECNEVPIPCAVGDYVMVAGNRAYQVEPPFLFDGRKLLIVDGEGIQDVLTGVMIDADGNIKSGMKDAFVKGARILVPKKELQLQ